MGKIDVFVKALTEGKNFEEALKESGVSKATGRTQLSKARKNGLVKKEILKSVKVNKKQENDSEENSSEDFEEVILQDE
jgi:transposase